MHFREVRLWQEMRIIRYKQNRRRGVRRLQLGKAIPLRTYEQIAGNRRAGQHSTAKTVHHSLHARYQYKIV